MDVDDERFTIRRAAQGQGGTAYDWLSGPDKGYGFGSSGPPHRSMEEHREEIRAFLAMIDPDTGYIGDDGGALWRLTTDRSSVNTSKRGSRPKRTAPSGARSFLARPTTARS
jgi:hypothetical protein